MLQTTTTLQTSKVVNKGVLIFHCKEATVIKLKEEVDKRNVVIEIWRAGIL